MRKIGTILTTDTTPEEITMPWPAAATQLMRFRFNVAHPDGRIGSPTYVNTVVQA